MKSLPFAPPVCTALALTLLAPAEARAQASCSLLASSYADSVLNPPPGEDTDFFVNGNGGVPNVFFFLANNETMQRLPPDGPASYGTPPPAGVVGCGLDSVSSPYTGANTAISNLAGNVYYSPCGDSVHQFWPTSTTQALVGNIYQGCDYPATANCVDYAHEASVCPYLTSSGVVTGSDGYDPTIYPTFFGRDRVYHDNNLNGAWTSTTPNGDGWASALTGVAGNNPMAAYPWQPPSGVSADLDGFCSRQTGTQGGLSFSSICTACLTQRGFYFAGTSNTNSRVETAPNVWFRGNYLNFYPPKWILARKVLKDVIKDVRKVRLGFSFFASKGNGNNMTVGREGATLKDSDKAQALNPPCAAFGTPSAFDNNRKGMVGLIDQVNFPLGASATLAEALLNIGQYYAYPTGLNWTTSQTDWDNPNGYYKGSNSDPGGSFASGTGNQASICFACQASAVIMIADGDTFLYDTHIPPGTFPATGATVGDPNLGIAGIADMAASPGDAVCPRCGAANDSAKYLVKVAYFLHHVDLRPSTETDHDNNPMDGKQKLDIYTVGLGTASTATERLLQDAAWRDDTNDANSTGGGMSKNAANARELKDAIITFVNDINGRSTSFGVASFSTLQATAGQGVLVPRFEPSRSAHWNGHLYRFTLYSEFTAGCTVPATGTSGPLNKDFDCDGKCTSVFLQDADGAFIQESDTGSFVKNDPRDRAACNPTGTACAPPDCGTASSTAAVPIWDAGANLQAFIPDPNATQGCNSAADCGAGTDRCLSGICMKPNANNKPWTQRKVFTVYDSAAPFGVINSADTMLQIDGSSDATMTSRAITLTPYLNIQGNNTCSKLADRLQAASNPAGDTVRTEITGSPPVYTACAKVILQYVLGADVFNETLNACGTFPTTYCDRAFKLGDVFHSSPVEVWAPLPSDGILCSRGLHNQCLPSLFSASLQQPSTETPANANAYDDYSKSTIYKHRNRFTLVGANDGMLHAFLSGTWHPNADDLTTPQDESQPPFEGFYDSGTGEELWAFIPPDLLGKLSLLLGQAHQYYVDASPMVRDVWIDASINKLGSTTTTDSIRQKNEFHTVAVVGERRGGTHYFALDVTDAGNDSGLDGQPKFLWIYPQPNDPEELAFGETYADFLPTPPPIGPVRLDKDAPPCASNYPTFQTSAGIQRCFEERWVVFLAGGWDVQYTKGRGVHMVDIKTGEEIFDFSQPAQPASSCAASSDPRCHLNYPVPATIGMMMWGNQANFMTQAATSGYFDTATFGDAGGQLWVLRFSDPGIKDANGKVTNWFGARILQLSISASTPECGLDFCGSQPFFHVTANLPLQANGLYRTFAGTGDRFNLLDRLGGQCGPDNIRACILKGCSVTLDDGSGGDGAVYGVSNLLGSASYHMNLPAQCSGVDTSQYSLSTALPSGSSCSSITSKVKNLTISCPSTVTCSGSTETTAKSVQVNCSGNSCTPDQYNDPGQFIDLTNDTGKKNWFFSVLVFESSGGRQLFSTSAGAVAYDQARLTETDLTSINAYDASSPRNSALLATPDSRGWALFFDHQSTGVSPFGGTTTYNLYRSDERTASGTAVEAGCAFWNTLQPAVPQASVDASNCPVNSPCKASRKQLSYLYGASPSTGGLCLTVNGDLTRYQQSTALVPPQIGKLVAYVGSGQVSFGLTSVRIPQGGTNISLGSAVDATSLIEWIDIDQSTEQCRHFNPNWDGMTGSGPNCR